MSEPLGDLDIRMMRRALDLAARGRGLVSPNPMVGAVIVSEEGSVIAEGFTQPYGGNHAEIEALHRVPPGLDLSSATLYVTLEPCAHHGATPPCAEAVAASGIGRVVVAMRDPNPLVNGRGNSILREAGCSVVVGTLEAEARQLNEAWLHYIRTGRPWVVVKVAQSLDGYIALPDGESQWITGELSRTEVHRLRASCDAVLVGTRTALTDDPSLTIRHEVVGSQPLRIVLDRNLELPDHLKLFTDEHRHETVVMTGDDHRDHTRVDRLREAGVRIEFLEVEGNPEYLRLDRVIDRLGALDVTSVLIEGGAAVIDTMIADDLADKLILFLGPKLLGHGLKSFGRLAATDLASARTLTIHRSITIGEDVMIEAYLR